ncbi:hypothetical protein K4A83_20725 [Spirulina subsalsa FACHB-351]|uniref:Isochorismate synthase n=1 Tax=Spirulina subsalsa FACHB-351 TaxID=234711 RepID=A0ABT3LAZ1_9CYAN|nr:hypothetical protein [Spirulina subsalsa]MCW6038678.1 hypothetical protein [Spirulina subsalsa FACHB-351]
MKLSQRLNQLNTYFSEAVARIFGPSDDSYPTIGVQPFSGDLPSKSAHSHR